MVAVMTTTSFLRILCSYVSPFVILVSLFFRLS